MTTVEVKNGEWVLCRGQAVFVSEEEIARAVAADRTVRKYPRRTRTRLRIVENIALGKRIGTYRNWPRGQGQEE
jgi:hypothetical protein